MTVVRSVGQCVACVLLYFGLMLGGACRLSTGYFDLGSRLSIRLGWVRFELRRNVP